MCCHPNGATHRSATSGGGSLQNLAAKTLSTLSHARPKWRLVKPTWSRLRGHVGHIWRWFGLTFFRQRCLFLALTSVAICHLDVYSLRSNANSLACTVFSSSSPSASLLSFISLQIFLKKKSYTLIKGCTRILDDGKKIKKET